jgi:lysophospholipase L1-like esterase
VYRIFNSNRRSVALLAAFLSISLAGSQARDLGRLAVVGDSLSAGFQNGTLLGCQQVNGYANLVANLAGSPIVLPLIAFPGIPSVNPQLPPTGRLYPLQQATDVAVPGQTVGQALTMRPILRQGFPLDPEPVQTMANLVLGFPDVLLNNPPRTQIETVQGINPQTVIVWLGSNDVLGVFLGLQSGITDPVTFAQTYDRVLGALASQNRTLIVTTIPDITLTPFMDGVIQLNRATDPTLRLRLKATVVAYNAAIVLLAVKYRATLVDIFSLVNKLAADGISIAGRSLTTKAGGGLFSLDGVHPTNTGYGIIAKEFIETINQRLNMSIRRPNLQQIVADDPLVPGNIGRLPPFCTSNPPLMLSQP